MKEKIILAGAGGHGLDTLDAAKGQKRNVIGFIDNDISKHGSIFHGLPVFGNDEWLLNNKEFHIVSTIGNPLPRKKFVDFINKHNIHVALPIVHPHSYIADEVCVGEGTVILGGCIIQPCVKIGRHVYISHGVTLGHDVIVNDFASIHPGVNIGGETTVGHGCYIGMGASILPRLKLGEWSIIGGGAVVINDVPDYVTVVGVPAKTIKYHR